ncbi:histidine kinase [Spongiactinospora sp. TRM90649]|uniref:sensor histidine kinase n=1 Tax=Spongiactinospora sp. TRM90649 TaxID=3031114 RepID=UPI0023F96AC1|nr:histidine kinase [Spongiactinospora sp. TRM90649]MDF5756757.1 histidine kinase [Spongiactinospora sp. TRM90649]
MNAFPRVPRALGRLVIDAVTGLAAPPLLAALGVWTLLGRDAGAGPGRAVRVLAARRRAWAGRVLGREVPAGDGPGWHAAAWLAAHAVAGPGALAVVCVIGSAVSTLFALPTARTGGEITLALSLAILAVIAVAAATAVLLRSAQARLAEVLLGPGTARARRIRELTESRAAAAGAQAAELRRIERDLHDGAQARLVAVRMTLGLARGSHDPDQVRALVDEAWESAGQALTDLRDLVRGVHPPVLADRGLEGAIRAAALMCPMPVEVDVELPRRPDAPLESALYFAAAESLTNVTRHSDAGRAWVHLRRRDGGLRLTVGDDGRGGADPSAGSGLLGIGRRLSAFDGTLDVRSPAGGPTVLTMEVPCAS